MKSVRRGIKGPVVITFPDSFGSLAGTWEVSVSDLSVTRGGIGYYPEVELKGLLVGPLEKVERDVVDVMEL